MDKFNIQNIDETNIDFFREMAMNYQLLDERLKKFGIRFDFGQFN